jgi:hypothetical protein
MDSLNIVTKLSDTKELSMATVIDELLGKKFRFQSNNYRDRYLRHQNYRIKIDPNDGSGLYQLDSSFRIVPGLAGTGISFQSENYPDHYIRHTNYECYIHKSDGSDLFKKDASWNPQRGLANAQGFSFESVNYPGFFIRHSLFLGRIDRRDGSGLFDQDATWLPILLEAPPPQIQWIAIKNAANGEVLDVAGGKTNPETQVLLYAYNGGNNQQWQITADGVIKSKLGNYALDMKEVPGWANKLLVINPINGSATQQWVLGADGTIKNKTNGFAIGSYTADSVQVGIVYYLANPAQPIEKWAVVNA